MTASPSSMPRVFQCPSCGASLQAPDEGTSTVCQYCNNTVVIPEELRPRQGYPQVVITTGMSDERTAQALRTAAVVTGGATAATAGCGALGAVVAVLVAVLAAGLIAWLSLAGGGPDGGPGPIAVPGILASPTPAFASVTLEFGGQGTGAGKFEDARYIAVDGDGNVFVAEYGKPYFVKFDQTGKFLMQVDIPGERKRYVGGMVADYAGHVWITYDHKLHQFDGASGKLLNTLEEKFPAPGYDGLAVDSSNRIYALLSGIPQDSFAVLDAEGNRLETRAEMVGSVDEDLTVSGLIFAVDGRGTMFVSGSFIREVLVFDANGKFKDRFGSEGREPGQFTSPGALAVDSRSRLYVDDFSGIQVFSASGDFVARIEWDYTRGSIMGLTIDRQDNIWAITNQGKIVKLEPYGQ